MSEQRAAPTNADLIWHELECGAYGADFSVWESLAAGAAGPILDLGCGTGRVAMQLGREGHEVVGVDIDPDFVAEVNRRAQEHGVSVQAVQGDACDARLEQRFGLVLAPMQLVQMLPDAGRRGDLLANIKAHLGHDGRAALALVEPDIAEDEGGAPLPDVQEVDGWIYSSLPVAIHDAGDKITVRRLRQTVSPEGTLTDGVDEVVICAIGSEDLIAEARAAGLQVADRQSVPPTSDHVGSTVIVLEA